MATKNIQRMKIAQANRPGALVIRASKYTKRLLLLFGIVAIIAVGLQILEIGPPGMAWYVYQ